MDELQALQQQFQALQQQEAQLKLSERVCVELLLKLLDTKRVNVYYSLSGREYVTPAQLECDIEDEILRAGGRVNIVDLQAALSVDLSHIDVHAKKIIAESTTNKRSRTGKLIFLHGEIIAEYYLDRMAEEINESLAIKGFLHVMDLSKRFNVSSDVIVSAIEERIGKQIHGLLDSPLLYTDQFIQRNKAILRGKLRALTRPVPISVLLQGWPYQPSLFHTLLGELLHEYQISGNIQGRREQQFVPLVYHRMRDNFIQSFFTQNNYIEYEMLSKLDIGGPVKYLSDRFPDGVALDSCFLSSMYAKQIEETIIQAVSDGEWVHIPPLLPSPLTETDINKLLLECPYVKQNFETEVFVFAECYIVTQGFLTKLTERFMQHYTESATNANAPSSQAQLVSSGSISAAPPRAKSRAADSDDDDDDDDDLGSSGKRNKSKKGRAASKSKKARGKGGNTLHSSSELSANQQYDSENKALILQWYPEIPPELASEILSQIRSKLAEMRDQAARAVFLRTAAATASKREDWETELSNLHFNVQLFQKSARQYGDPGELLEKHLLKTLCTDFFTVLIQMQAFHQFISVDEDKLSVSSYRTKIIGDFKKEISKALLPIEKSLNQSVDAFLDACFGASECCQIHLRSLDKKREAQLIESHRQLLTAQLNDETSASNAYQIAILLLYLRVFGNVLHAPGRCITTIAQKVIPHLDAEAASTVEGFGRLVVTLLAAEARSQKAAERAGGKAKGSRAGGRKDAADVDENDLVGNAEVLAQLDEMLPSLKHTVLHTPVTTVK